MQPLLPEDSLCSGMSWVEALQDSFKARSGSRAPQVCLLGLLLWNFLKVISWKPFSPAFTVIPMMHSQLWPSASTGCRRSFLPDVLLSASYLHSSWASCRSHMPQWPSRRNCPQSIHGRVSAHPAIRRKKNTATLKINIFPARKEIFCKFLQYMLSNTFLQHKRLSVHIQQKRPNTSWFSSAAGYSPAKTCNFSLHLLFKSPCCAGLCSLICSLCPAASPACIYHITPAAVYGFKVEGKEAAMTWSCNFCAMLQLTCLQRFLWKASVK